MKKIMLLIPLLFLLGCVSQKQIDELEAKIAKLEKQKASDTMLLAEQAGARRFWWRNGLFGGGSALDGITGLNNSNDGDAAFVMVKTGTGASAVVTGYLYIYVSDDDTLENPPDTRDPSAAGEDHPSGSCPHSRRPGLPARGSLWAYPDGTWT